MSAGAIWIFVKLPQEWWIHIAKLDVTDMIAEVPWFGPAIVVATGELASLVAEQTDCIDRVKDGDVPEQKRFLLRLDPEVFDALERWAGDELRSINGQIDYLLEDALRRSGRHPRRRRLESESEDGAEGPPP